MNSSFDGQLEIYEARVRQVMDEGGHWSWLVSCPPHTSWLSALASMSVIWILTSLQPLTLEEHVYICVSGDFIQEIISLWKL